MRRRLTHLLLFCLLCGIVSTLRFELYSNFSYKYMYTAFGPRTFEWMNYSGELKSLRFEISGQRYESNVFTSIQLIVPVSMSSRRCYQEAARVAENFVPNGNVPVEIVYDWKLLYAALA